MTPLQILAASARPLDEVFVDRIRRANRWKQFGRSVDPRNNGGHTGKQRELPLMEAEQEDAQLDDSGLRHVRPDEVAAAVLLGRGLDRHRDVLRRLDRPTSITVIEVPSPNLVDLVEKSLKDLVLSELDIINGDRCETGDDLMTVDGVAIFSRGIAADKKTSKKVNSSFGAAVQRGCAIIGIASDPDRTLPSELVRLSDARIALPPFDAESVAVIIQAITGRKPAAVPDDVARRASTDALMACVRPDFGARGSLRRLQTLLCSDRANAGPALGELHGLGAARAWGEGLAADLCEYKAGRLPWSEIDRGALITGAPGTGKTTFARALARAADVHFVATSYSNWQSNGDGHLGFVTKAIRAVFAEARERKPSILFIDEIDTLPARGTSTRHDEWWTAITNSLLEELDGFERREGVIVIAACNNPSRLDPALVRAGRL
ncbi:MAG TPA: ATP-binding protein, partial [Pseudolabrys sp.]|nr:ATP-binding protein [Pseudolabrys sp.]